MPMLPAPAKISGYLEKKGSLVGIFEDFCWGRYIKYLFAENDIVLEEVLVCPGRTTLAVLQIKGRI